MHDVTAARYKTTFSADHCTMSGPRSITGREEEMIACTDTGMIMEEFMHLKFNHAISYCRMAQMSSAKVPGIPPHLKDKKQPCEICQHANITRQDAPPAATGTTEVDCHFDIAGEDSGKCVCGVCVERLAAIGAWSRSKIFIRIHLNRLRYRRLKAQTIKSMLSSMASLLRLSCPHEIGISYL